MSKDFVECRNGSFYLIGSRIPLAHVVREFQRGESPEAIRLHYPALSLEQVYGAISFYLGRKGEVVLQIREIRRSGLMSGVGYLDGRRGQHPVCPGGRALGRSRRQDPGATGSLEIE